MLVQLLVGLKAEEELVLLLLAAGVQELFDDGSTGLATRSSIVLFLGGRKGRTSYHAITVVWLLLAAREPATPAVTMASMSASTSPIVNPGMVVRR